MAGEGVRLAPEVEAILQDVARDPDSALLRVPRKSVLPALMEDRSVVGVATAGLSVLERELVRVHRNELAWLLREACFHKLLEGPKSKGLVLRFSPDGEDVETLSPSDVAERVETERSGSGVQEATRNAFELLDRCARDPLGEDPSVSRLAAASFRLEPTDQARLLAGAGLSFEGSQMAAIRLMGVVLSGRPSDAVACSAWSTTGMAYAAKADTVRAHDAYRAACSVRANELFPVMYRLLFSVQNGNLDDARTASHALVELGEQVSAQLESFVGIQCRAIRNGVWRPSAVGRHVALTVSDELGDAGRRIMDVFSR